MVGFVLYFINWLDVKGCVLILVFFCVVLVRDGFEGFYCIVLVYCFVVDGGGNGFVEEIQVCVQQFVKFIFDYDMFVVVFFGVSEIFKVDGDGCMIIFDMIWDYMGLVDQVIFVGMDYKFQIWELEKFCEYCVEV